MRDEIYITEVVDKFYNIISGKVGQVRDWISFKNLFFENAHLMAMKLDEEKEIISRFIDVNSYIKGLNNFLEIKDFYEYGFNYKINVFQNIAQVYSEYEARVSIEDTRPIKIGVNLINLIKCNNEWKILSMVWQDK